MYGALLSWKPLGQIVTGLLRREEGTNLILADPQGKEVRIVTSQIAERSLSTLSLMPENIATDLLPQDLFDLMDYLLTQRAAVR